MKWSIKGYSFPTPIKIRKVADSILAACGTSAIVSAAANYAKIGVSIAVIGFLAKYVSDYYKEENTNADAPK